MDYHHAPLRMGPQILQMRKCNKASIPSGNSGQGLPGRTLSLLKLLTGSSLFMGNEPAQQQGSCHPLTSLWPSPASSPPKCRSSLSLSVQYQDPHLAQVLSHLEHCSHQSPVSPSPPSPFLLASVVLSGRTISCCKPSGVTVPHRV